MEPDFVTLAGVRSRVVRAGPASRTEAVVFVHGNPGSVGDWADLIEPVSAFARVLALDMPGYGMADRPDDFDYTVAGYAAHLGAAIDVEGIRRVHLVLHDFGGPWGLAWAAAHPGRAASVTLINIGILPGYRWHYMARIWRRRGLGELAMAMTTRSALGLALRHGNPRGLPPAYLDELWRHYDRGLRRAVLRLYRNTSDLGALSDELAAALTPQHLPALVLWGACDPYVPLRYAEIQHRYFEVEDVVRLADSGHWPMIDHPEATRAAVLPFLRRQLQGPRRGSRP